MRLFPLKNFIFIFVSFCLASLLNETERISVQLQPPKFSASTSFYGYGARKKKKNYETVKFMAEEGSG
jgi:hypothetical protein